jgi:methylglutaconyl-CoA hydratase
MTNDFETIKFTRTGKVLNLVLNRPEQHNALNGQMVREITLFFRQAGEDNDALAITIKGEGKSFCAGADLLWMKNSANLTPEENLAETLELSAMFEAIQNCPKVVIGMAHGSIFGGGNGLLAACDLAYCTRESRFSLSETRIGLVAATISPYLLHRMAPAAVKELLFTAERFDGIKAEATGLVNRSFISYWEMEKYVSDTIKAILEGGPSSIIESKKLVNHLSGFRFPEETNDRMAEILAYTRISPEAQEGMQAFIEKRQPSWKPQLNQ